MSLPRLDSEDDSCTLPLPWDLIGGNLPMGVEPLMHTTISKGEEIVDLEFMTALAMACCFFGGRGESVALSPYRAPDPEGGRDHSICLVGIDDCSDDECCFFGGLVALPPYPTGSG